MEANLYTYTTDQITEAIGWEKSVYAWYIVYIIMAVTIT